MANAQSLHAEAVAELLAADAALPSVDEQLTAMSLDESATLSVELAHPHPCPHPRAHALLPISQERSSFSEGASPRTPGLRHCAFACSAPMSTRTRWGTSMRWLMRARK